MTLDLGVLRAAIDAHGPVVRVVVAEARGSVPRGVGTSMLVWADGFSGTIGGGALEWRALCVARSVLETGVARVERMPLGPALGQCCGGAVTLVAERLDVVPEVPWVRRVEGAAVAPVVTPFGFRDGWLAEDDTTAQRFLWIWGAGHVGAAIARIVAPLPGVEVICVDDDLSRFPTDLPAGVTTLIAADMTLAMGHAPTEADHLILTYSHEIDLALCHAALLHGFRSCGLIGSETKWARFRTRLEALGHGAEEIARITCPIGDPRLGKDPQAIAIGVAAALLCDTAPCPLREGIRV